MYYSGEQKEKTVNGEQERRWGRCLIRSPIESFATLCHVCYLLFCQSMMHVWHNRLGYDTNKRDRNMMNNKLESQMTNRSKAASMFTLRSGSRAQN